MAGTLVLYVFALNRPADLGTPLVPVYVPPGVAASAEFKRLCEAADGKMLGEDGPAADAAIGALETLLREAGLSSSSCTGTVALPAPVSRIVTILL